MSWALDGNGLSILGGLAFCVALAIGTAPVAAMVAWALNRWRY